MISRRFTKRQLSDTTAVPIFYLPKGTRFYLAVWRGGGRGDLFFTEISVISDTVNMMVNGFVSPFKQRDSVTDHSQLYQFLVNIQL